MAKRRAKGAFIDIRESPSTLKNFRLVRELEERRKKLLRAVPYAVAQTVYDDLMSGIPNTPEYKEMKKNLEVAEVRAGKKGKSAAYTVHAPTKSRRVKKTDVSRTAIYIKAKRRLNPMDPAIKILEDHSPWTMDTIRSFGFWPKNTKAVIVQRRVKAQEVDRIRKERTAEKAKIRRELEKVGKRIPARKGLGISKKSKAIPDIGIQALALEFGSDGKRGKPVWRTDIGGVSGGGIRRLPNRFPEIKKIWFDPNQKRRWPPRVQKTSSSEASKYMAFQKRIR